MRMPILGLALVACVAISACGGAGGSTTTRSHQASTVATSSTPAPTPATAAATATATVTATATAGAGTSGATSTQTNTAGDGAASVGGTSQPCRAAGLALAFLGGQGATGHGELGFALRNSGSACSTVGYPGVQFLDQRGGPLPTTPDHATDDFFGSLPLRQLAVAPGQSVSFRLGVSHGDGSSAGCTTAYGLQVIAPNDTATLRVQIPGGASECGVTTVSPVQPGDSAYP
jgi:hypothetical protein